MTKQKIIQFKESAVKNSTKEANKILNKDDDLTFKEMQDRDDYLTYKRLMEDDLNQLKNRK